MAKKRENNDIELLALWFVAVIWEHTNRDFIWNQVRVLIGKAALQSNQMYGDDCDVGNIDSPAGLLDSEGEAHEIAARFAAALDENWRAKQREEE